MSAVVTELFSPKASGLSEPALPHVLARAQDIYRNGQPEQALARADWILGRFRDSMAAGTRYICLSDAAEADEKQHQRPAEWKKVDRTYCDALMFKAFLLVELGRLDAAMGLLQQAAEHAPRSPHPHAEMGYILNAQKKYAGAFRIYHEALKRARAYPGDLAAQATALRGIGFALSELGDLRAARVAYLDALAIEPGNELALNELRYLDHQLTRSPVE